MLKYQTRFDVSDFLTRSKRGHDEITQVLRVFHPDLYQEVVSTSKVIQLTHLWKGKRMSAERLNDGLRVSLQANRDHRL